MYTKYYSKAERQTDFFQNKSSDFTEKYTYPHCSAIQATRLGSWLAQMYICVSTAWL